jgi:hypothetical protein
VSHHGKMPARGHREQRWGEGDQKPNALPRGFYSTLVVFHRFASLWLLRTTSGAMD